MGSPPFADVVNERLMLMRGGRDFDGDGIPEALIGDMHDHEPPSRAIVLFGGGLEARAAPLGLVKGTLQIVKRGACPDDQDSCSFSRSFSFAGDVNGDRHEDLVIVNSRKAWIYFNPLGPLHQARPFRRGDANADGVFDLTDAIAVLGYLFIGSEEPPCLDAADIDDGESLDISDAIRLLGWLFLGGGPPAPPGECGSDPEGVDLDCRESACP
jgi:hypothetical protein